MKKPSPRTAPLLADAPSEARTKRRQLVVGAGVAAGAAVAAAAVGRRVAAPAATAEAALAPEPAQGYRLTDHVRRYYDTTRT